MTSSIFWTFKEGHHRRFLTLHNENFFTPFVAGRFSYQPAMMVVANNISFGLSEVRTTSSYFCNNCIFVEYYFLKLLCYSISLIVWTTWSGDLRLRFVQGWYVSCSALWRQMWLVFSKMWLLWGKVILHVKITIASIDILYVLNPDNQDVTEDALALP